jgi:hypothetical protein
VVIGSEHEHAARNPARSTSTASSRMENISSIGRRKTPSPVSSSARAAARYG